MASIIKKKLAELANSRNINGDVPLEKEAFRAFNESTELFIRYVLHAANDICGEGGRKIIEAEDVLKALDELKFKKFVQPLQESSKLPAHNKENNVPEHVEVTSEDPMDI